jgi:uncharacterized membrane protein YfcA
MRTLILFGLVGLFAQLVDGTLGMAYGVTATTLLLTTGITPAIASASVHLAEVGTTFVSGLSHWKFNNIDWRTVGLIAIPGAIGSVLGAYVLTSLSTEAAEPWMSTILVILGLYVMIRFGFLKLTRQNRSHGHGAKFLGPLGLIAGFVDATGGGGWGPVATTTLLTSGRLEPRKVVGSIDTAEFVVAIAASVGFLATLSSKETLDWSVVAALLVGGVIAAPFAAWLVKHLPARVLGAAAGGIIVLNNAKIIIDAVGATGIAAVAIYALIVVVWVAGITAAIRSLRAEKAATPEPENPEDEPAKVSTSTA